MEAKEESGLNNRLIRRYGEEAASRLTSEDKLLGAIFSEWPTREDLLSRPERSEVSHEDVITIPDTETLERSGSLLREEVEATLSILTERESLVLRHRFGLINGRIATQKETGLAINRSDRTVRRIEQSALAKLAKAPKSTRFLL